MKKYKKPLSTDQIANLEDKDINFSNISELDASFWDNAKTVNPEETKKQLTIRLDADIVDWFKSQGKGYQTHMNSVLRSFYESQHH